MKKLYIIETYSEWEEEYEVDSYWLNEDLAKESLNRKKKHYPYLKFRLREEVISTELEDY